MFDTASGTSPHRGELVGAIPLSGAALADSFHESESYDGQFDEFWWQIDPYAEDWYDAEPPDDRRPFAGDPHNDARPYSPRPGEAPCAERPCGCDRKSAAECVGALGDSELLQVLDAAVDRLTDGRVRLGAASEQLALLATGVRIGSRIDAWLSLLAASIETQGAAWEVHGTSTATWLAGTMNVAPRDASRLIRSGQQLTRFPVIAAAATQGRVSFDQASAITNVLAGLPGDLPADSVTEAEEAMVGFAQTHTPLELRRLSAHLLEVVCPEVAERAEAARVEREYRAAVRNRRLDFSSDGCGSVLIRGSLPACDAEPFIRIVDAYSAQQKRALDAADPQADYVSPAMRRADGLMAMVHHHAQQALAPVNGGDRPRIVVTLTHDALLRQAVDAGLATDDGRLTAAGDKLVGPARSTTIPIVGTEVDSAHRTDARSADAARVAGVMTATGEPLPGSVLRRLLCDADVLPVVLGGPSQILDVGRTQRLVTGPIRAALDVRDGGCVFPGCDKVPTACEAHHIEPWWAGGATALSNLVLVCPHHHGIVEPGHDPTADRWKIRLGSDGLPDVIPPLRVDPARRPRRHARFHTARNTWSEN